MHLCRIRVALYKIVATDPTGAPLPAVNRRAEYIQMLVVERVKTYIVRDPRTSVLLQEGSHRILEIEYHRGVYWARRQNG